MIKRKILRDLPIEELPLSTRSYTCLLNSNIRTIGELACMTESQLKKTRNFGRVSLAEIKDALDGVGLHLAAKEKWISLETYRLAMKIKLAARIAKEYEKTTALLEDRRADYDPTEVDRLRVRARYWKDFVTTNKARLKLQQKNVVLGKLT